MSEAKVIGKVVSIKTANMVVVSVTRMKVHPIYKKAIRRMRRFAVHNSGDVSLSVGDLVVIAETKPMSKTKHYKVIAKA